MVISYVIYKRLNLSPISFYGLVLDQNDKRVANAQVILAISKYGKLKIIETKTDDDGKFSVKGKYGTSLKISAIKKSGYSVNLNGKSHFLYGRRYSGRHIPDPINPVIFQIWENSGGANLVHGKLKIDIESGASPVYVNLLDEKIYTSPKDDADILFYYRRWERNRNDYDWSIAVDVIQGGLIVTDDTYLFKAPETGYTQNFKYVFSHKQSKPMDSSYSKNWKMYVKSHNGKHFSAIEWRMYTHSDGKARIALSYFMNPYGSTNLAIVTR